VRGFSLFSDGLLTELVRGFSLNKWAAEIVISLLLPT
jgi:hypothetical protein